MEKHRINWAAPIHWSYFPNLTLAPDRSSHRRGSRRCGKQVQGPFARIPANYIVQHSRMHDPAIDGPSHRKTVATSPRRRACKSGAESVSAIAIDALTFLAPLILHDKTRTIRPKTQETRTLTNSGLAHQYIFILQPASIHCNLVENEAA